MSAFLTGLTRRQILGSRGSDGRVHVPPAEYDPITFSPLTELVPVAGEGTVLTWTWVTDPQPGQPLSRPFGWALIKLDGADTALLHAVDAGAPSEMSTGMRVQARWADSPTGSIHDVAFVPTPQSPSKSMEPVEQQPVTGIVTPIHLRYTHTAAPAESRYLQALAQGKIVGRRCPGCEKVYVPARGACPACGVPTGEDVELAHAGTITTFCIVNIPFPGQRTKPPYVTAAVLLDGADTTFQHLILGCAADEVRIGMRVKAVWKAQDLWGTTPENIDHFAPSGEPDAEYDTYAEHV